MNDLVTIAVVGFGLGLTAALTRRFARHEQTFIWSGFLLHCGFSVAMVLVTQNVLGGGDIFTYAAEGQRLSHMLTLHFDEYAPRLVRILFHLNVDRFIVPHGLGDSTGSMYAISGFMAFALGGSVYAMCMVVAIGSFLGKVALYSGLKHHFPVRFHQRLLIGCLLVPSAIFWSAGLLKEGIAMIGLGPAIWAVLSFGRASRGKVIVAAVFGLTVVGLFKSYLLVPLFVATAAFLYWRGAKAKGKSIVIRPLYLLLAGGVATLAVVGIGELFPQYSVTQVSDELANIQQIGARTRGTANYALSGSGETTAATQVALAPVAALTALFRPLLFEVKNAQMAVNAVEMLVIQILFLLCLLRVGLTRCLQLISASPALIFASVFAAILAVGVGLGSTNLGSLSRYRVPLMPLYVSCLLILTHPSLRRSAIPESSTAEREGKQSSVAQVVS